MPTLPGEGDDLENLLLQKGGRGGTSGGTGIGGGGGFGGAFGGGGSGFLAGGGGSLGGDLMGGPMKRKFVMGANGQIPLSYTPLKSQDTVPAMLSPGEYVVNNRAMQMPGAQEFVAALNAAGNGGHYAEGGPVGGGMMLDQDTLRLLLQLLTRFAGGETEGPEQESEDGPQGVQHFAWGGMARPQQGGFSAPQMPSGGQYGGGMGSQSGRAQFAPQGASSGLSRIPTMQPMGRRMAGPNPVNPALNPPPGGYTPGVTPQLGVPGDWGINQGTNAPGTMDIWNLPGMQQMRDLLNQYGAGGAFSPEGSRALMNSVQANATSNADAMRARQQNQLALGGMDAGQAAAMKQMQDLRGQGDVANALNSAQSGLLMNQQQFAQGLLGQMSQAQLADYMAQLAARVQAQAGK